MIKQCIAPHEIHEGDLVAYIEGVAPATVVKHIPRCPACTAEVNALRRVDSVLRSALSQAGRPQLNGNFSSQAKVITARQIPAQRSRVFSVGWQRLAWLKSGLSRRRPGQMALVYVQLIVLLAVLAGIYYIFSSNWLNSSPDMVNKQAGATVVTVVKETHEMMNTAPDETPPQDSYDTDFSQASLSTGAMSEDDSAISPPRDLLKLLEDEWHAQAAGHLLVYYLEDASAIAPPRNLLRMLERERQARTARPFAYMAAFDESWSENLVVDTQTGQAYAVWVDNGNGYPTIYFARSTDGGQTWSDEVAIQHGLKRVFNPSLALGASGNLYLVWRGGRNLEANIYFARSTDGGQTWSQSVRINETPGKTFKPSLAIDKAGRLYVAWQNRRNTHTDIYFIHSTDGGQTWSNETRIANIGS